jgi:hypothetical protein
MSAQTDYESRTFREYSRKLEEMDLERDEEGLAEAEPDYEAIMERKGKRHPGDFYGDWPSNEQLSYFVRGGR